MFVFKIENAKFEKGDFCSCTFQVNGKKYWLPIDDCFKPTFLLNGVVPLEVEEGEIEPSLLAQGSNLPSYLRGLTYLSDDPRLVRLGFIHFLENYHERVTESQPVLDKLSLEELDEFWVLNHYDNNYDSWLELVEKIYSVRISDIDPNQKEKDEIPEDVEIDDITAEEFDDLIESVLEEMGEDEDELLE